MSWTAIVPLKAPAERKSRLASRFAPAQRAALSERMAAHVLDVVGRTPNVERVILLAPAPMRGLAWVRDRGRGLNAELCAARGRTARVLVVHADLPLLTVADLAALIAAAEVHGAAIAPDRRRLGTNAIALADAGPFRFAFGHKSLRAHCLRRRFALVETPGLGHDVDSAADLRGLPRLWA